MDQKRFILAAALSLGVILVWQNFFAPKPPSPPDTKQKKTAQTAPDAEQNEEPSTGPDTGTEKTPTAAAGSANQPGPGEAERESPNAGDAGTKGTSATGSTDAGSGARPGRTSGEAISDRERSAWMTCLEAVSREFDSEKTQVALQPSPGAVDCSETSCQVDSQVDRRDSDDTVPFRCVTDNGEVVSFSKTDASSDGSRGAGSGGQMKPADSKRDVSIDTHVMESERVRVRLTNAGTGRLESIRMVEPSEYSARGDILDEFPDDSSHYPYGIAFAEGSIPLPKDAIFEFVEEESTSEDGGETWQKVTYRYEDPQGRFRVDKTFEWSDEHPYLLEMDVEVHNNLDDSRLSDEMTLDMFGYKNPDEPTRWLNFRPNEIEGVCRMAGEAKRSSISSMDGPLSYDNSKPIWGAIDDRYFMTAAVPKEGSAKSCGIERVGEGYLRTRLQYEAFEVMPGESEHLAHELYLGPKDLDILGEVGHNLSSSVNYGLFAFIARPLRWALNVIQTNLVSNWGLAIILLTIVIKLLTWPINMKAYRSMQGMKEIQPELEEIRDKYDDDQQRMTEETMKLFRENDVSPMGGCLPMLLQMPILYGLYVMIYSSVELYEADFILWYTNLAAPDPFFVLPIIMGVVMFVQQGMMTSAGGNMQTKIMTKVMPFMFTGFMLFLPSGLVLYYSVNLIIGLGQQFYIRGIDVPYTDIEWDPGDSDDS
jgi:YidC/Oxa1 family membrane protein insertase